MERAHRPAALEGPRPRGLPRLVGRALQAAAARRAARHGRRHGRGLPDRALRGRLLQGRRADGGRRARRDRGGPGSAPHQGRGTRSRRTSRRPRRSPSRSSPTTTSRSAPATWRGSPTSPTAATAAATRSPSRRTTTRRPSWPTPATSTATPAAPTLSSDFEGKLVWKVDWPMRWAFEHVDFEPAGMDHATPGSSFTVGHSLVEDDLRHAAAGVVRLRVRGLRRRPEDVVVGGRRPDRRGRPADPRGADPALALRAPQPAPGLQHRLRTRGGQAVRRVGRAGPQGPRPRPSGRAGARLRAGLRDRLRRSPSHACGRRTVPAAVVGRRRDRRQRLGDQSHRLERRPPARVGGRPRAAALARHDLDTRLRPGLGPHHGPRPLPTSRGCRR